MPHLNPLLDRVVPRGYQSPGSYTELPRYRPIDFLRQPCSVRSLAEAVDAIRLCDEIATSLAVQRHCIKNTHFLIAAIVEHTFTQLVPLPLPETHPKAHESIWAQPILYAQQLDLLILLQRLMEHFAASVLSVAHTPATDATRMVVRPCHRSRVGAPEQPRPWLTRPLLLVAGALLPCDGGRCRDAARGVGHPVAGVRALGVVHAGQRRPGQAG